jgi:hypothetical protein
LFSLERVAARRDSSDLQIFNQLANANAADPSITAAGLAFGVQQRRAPHATRTPRRPRQEAAMLMLHSLGGAIGLMLVGVLLLGT